MKLIDQSPIKATDNLFKRLQFAVEGTLTKGFNWDEDLRAQELVAKHLSRLLDSKYTLLRNFRLSVDDEPFPLVLVGPPGLLAINPKGLRGVFQANSEDWLELDTRSRQYHPAEKNQITGTLELAKKLDTFLASGERQYPPSQPVLFLAHPGVHVDTNRPAVRIIRVDGIDRFGGSLPQAEAVLDAIQVQAVVDRLVGAFEASKKEKAEQASQGQEQGLEKKAAEPSPRMTPLNLTRSQFILLSAMGVIEILLLVAAVLVILQMMR